MPEHQTSSIITSSNGKVSVLESKIPLIEARKLLKSQEVDLVILATHNNIDGRFEILKRPEGEDGQTVVNKAILVHKESLHGIIMSVEDFVAGQEERNNTREERKVPRQAVN